MTAKKPSSDSQRLSQVIAEARRAAEEREKTYRQKALKLFPPICARCGREFAGKKLRELTVHHKDHNHERNPPDGSNWELLCIYCHDNEHSRDQVAEAYAKTGPGREPQTFSTHRPFAHLADLLKAKKEGS